MASFGEHDLPHDFPTEILESAFITELDGDLSKALKNYHDSQVMIGRQGATSVKMPSTDDSAAWDEAMDKLLAKAPAEFKSLRSKPDEIGGYELDAGENADKQAFLSWMHEAGLSKAQAKSVWDKNEASNTAKAEAMQVAADELNAGFEKEFGAGLEKYQMLAKGALKHFGDDDFAKMVTESDVLQNPHFLRFMAKVGESLGEDRISLLDAQGNAVTPAEIDVKIAEIESHPLWRKSLASGSLTQDESKEIKRMAAETYRLRQLKPGGRTIVSTGA